MDSAKQQLVEKLKSANNVLVTVSRNPSVDQLASLIGLSLLLNKQGKHCAAVFSGNIPSTLEFLKPEDTIEKNTDSLRDFIIALDKSKADKLRYKVEDNIVRIFITPYRTSISQSDLEFSQGDFNVDVVVALGVHDQTDLDESITAHGRILHDAVVASINVSNEGNLGSLNWNAPMASSLSELVTELAQALGNNLLDEQIANALLTGIVAQTDRFSNDKTTAETMSVSATLMAAGANQQLVATKLEEITLGASDTNPAPLAPKDSNNPPPKNDGTLQIKHDASQDSDGSNKQPPNQVVNEPPKDIELPEPTETANKPEEAKAQEPTMPVQNTPALSRGPKLITEPPTLGGTLTANASQNDIEPTTDPFSLPKAEAPQLLERKPENTPKPPDLAIPNQNMPGSLPPQPSTNAEVSAPIAPVIPEPILNNLTPSPPAWVPATEPPASDNQVHIDENGTLSQLEASVHSSHADTSQSTPDPQSAREEVNKALSASNISSSPPPIEALNAQPLGPELHAPGSTVSPLSSPPTNSPVMPPPDATPAQNALGPPPVPPPIPFEFGKPPS